MGNLKQSYTQAEWRKKVYKAKSPNIVGLLVRRNRVGFANWDPHTRTFRDLCNLKTFAAFAKILEINRKEIIKLVIVLSTRNEHMESFYRLFCNEYGIEYRISTIDKPSENINKKEFNNNVKYEGHSTRLSRKAAMIVYDHKEDEFLKNLINANDKQKK